jgi:hypothetical protein
MKRTFLIISLVLIAFCSAHILRAQTPTTPDEKAGQPRKTSGIFTMYALDPLARTFCFTDGKEGMRIANHQWGNRCSDLSFGLVNGGTLVAGIEVDRAAVIVDLGTNNDLRERYGFDDAENGAVGFASLRLEGNKIMVLQEDVSKPVWTTLKEGAPLFNETRASANAPIKLGHIYLVRIADSKNQSFRQIAKLMVIAYRPEESVTLRWELLTK